MSYFPYVYSQDRIVLFRQNFLSFLIHYYSAIPFHIGKGTEMPLANNIFRKQRIQKNQKNFSCSVGMHLSDTHAFGLFIYVFIVPQATRF